jgi:aspartate racemase
MLVPDEAGRNAVHHVVYDELVHGRIGERSRALYRGVTGQLVDRGAEGILLGCTEIGLLVHNGDAPVLIVDTMKIHAERAVELALA